MENSKGERPAGELFLDFSEEEQISFWELKLGLSREVIKSAARACRNNSVEQILKYLIDSKKLGDTIA